MRMKRTLILFLLLVGVSAFAQDKNPNFALPLDVKPVVFAGNFGEIRTNHFHGGLDFKTQGQVGKRVYAMADGYIFSAAVTSSSGYVLHVRFNNGYSAAYRHLSAFMGDVAQRVKDLQYKEEKWNVYMEFEKDEFPVTRGQQIAWSGNTGYSSGPHLHLDIYETESDDLVDPLVFFTQSVVDHTAPRIAGYALFPQAGKGVVNGKTSIQKVAGDAKALPTAWGWIGVGISAFDYMDGVHNRYGTKYVTLKVDGKPVFNSTVDRVNDNEHRYINSWTWGKYMKMFVAPGNKLRILHPLNDHSGLVLIDEERVYKFEFELKDAFGNTTRGSFRVRGQKSDIPAPNLADKRVLDWKEDNVVKAPGLYLSLPQGALYDETVVCAAHNATDGRYAKTYKITDTALPLHFYCDMQVALNEGLPDGDAEKYYIAQVDGQKEKYVGGEYKDGLLTAKVRVLGTFKVGKDTIPPVVTPVGQKNWAANGKIVFTARDAQTEVASYRGTIDGKYALFGIPNMMRGTIECKLDPSVVQRGRQHTLEFTATDACGNSTTRTYRFTW